MGDTSSASITPAISVLDASGVKVRVETREVILFLHDDDVPNESFICPSLHIQSVDELVPGQVVSLSLSKFPTDQVTTVTLMDATGKVAATIGK